MYFPHTVSSVRGAFDDTGVRGANTTPLTDEACLVSPEKVSPLIYTAMGPAEVDNGLLFIGGSADIETGDVLTDSNGDVWEVTSHPRSYSNPKNFSAGIDHKQADIRRSAMQ